jgi:ribonuclease P protein component
MLQKQNRLRKDREFQRVFKNSRPINLANFSIRTAKNNTKEENVRFGFVISNKIEKRSTRRNALKRQLREVSRGLISRLKPGYDVVVVIQKDFTFPYKKEEIKTQFEAGLKKSGIIN